VFCLTENATEMPPLVPPSPFPLLLLLSEAPRAGASILGAFHADADDVACIMHGSHACKLH